MNRFIGAPQQSSSLTKTRRQMAFGVVSHVGFLSGRFDKFE
jgi:hypothetical protein